MWIIKFNNKEVNIVEPCAVNSNLPARSSILSSLGYTPGGNSYIYTDSSNNTIRLIPLPITYRSNELLKKLTSIVKAFNTLSTTQKNQILMLSKALQ